MAELWIPLGKLIERWSVDMIEIYDAIVNGLPVYLYINDKRYQVELNSSCKADFMKNEGSFSPCKVKMTSAVNRLDFERAYFEKTLEYPALVGLSYKNNLHFLLSDVENYEARFRIKPNFHNSRNIKKEVKDIDQTSTSIPEQQHRTIPLIVFYEDGDFFRIGKNGEEKPIKTIKGFQLIHFLLQNRQQNLSSVEVFNLGRIQVTNKGTWTFDGMTIERSSFISLDKKARKAYIERIEELKEDLHSQSDNPQEQLEAKEEIEKLETELKKKRIQNTGSNEEKARTNVQRQIKRALAKIHEMCPDLERYLNKSTIKTGYLCSYQPVPNDPVEWILF